MSKQSRCRRIAFQCPSGIVLRIRLIEIQEARSQAGKKSRSPVAEVQKAIGPLKCNPERASFNNPGDFLLSHAVSRAVPSAPAGLTTVFGMGTGVTLPTKSPENFLKNY